MTRINKETPVVVLGSRGLGIMRSLGRLGVPIYVVSSDPDTSAFSSRYCIGKILSDIPKATEKSISNLLSVGSGIGRRSVLIPTTDQTVKFVAENAKALIERFIFPRQAPELVNSLCSKKGMYCVAKKFKIPTPEAVFPHDKGDLSSLLKTASFPLILKAIQGWRSPTMDKAIVYSKRELLNKYEELESLNDPDDPNIMIQEYIPGGDEATWLFEGYFDENSTSVFDVTGMKIRQWPPHAGFTSLGVRVRNETVTAMTRKFMKAIHYRGIADIGYRYDARDGQYKLLDFNPRIGSTFRLFVADHGMDVARALYLDKTDQPITHDSAVDGRKFLVEDADFASSLLSILAGELSIKQWVNSYRGVREGAFFVRDDPLPFVRLIARKVMEFSAGTGILAELAKKQKRNGRVAKKYDYNA